jgi:hypothetical protein
MAASDSINSLVADSLNSHFYQVVLRVSGASDLQSESLTQVLHTDTNPYTKFDFFKNIV